MKIIETIEGIACYIFYVIVSVVVAFSFILAIFVAIFGGPKSYLKECQWYVDKLSELIRLNEPIEEKEE